MWVNALSGGGVRMGDPYWGFVKAYVLCNGADAATTFTDLSTIGSTVTAAGNAQVDTSQVARGELLCDGTDDYISIAASSNLDMGASDFCVEAYVRWNALPASGAVAAIFGRWSGNTDGNRQWSAWLWNNAGVHTLQFSISTTGTNQVNKLLPIATQSTGVLYHYAIVRSGSNLNMYINGVVDDTTGSITETLSATSATPLWVGCTLGNTVAAPSAGSDSNAWFSGVRITIGSPRYTANFTPDVLPFITGAL